MYLLNVDKLKKKCKYILGFVEINSAPQWLKQTTRRTRHDIHYSAFLVYLQTIIRAFVSSHIFDIRKQPVGRWDHIQDKTKYLKMTIRNYIISDVCPGSHLPAWRYHDIETLTHWPLGNFNKILNMQFKTDFNDWWLRHPLWNCPNMNVTELYWCSVNIGSGNGLVPSGNKPLSGPMLTQIYVATWCH